MNIPYYYAENMMYDFALQDASFLQCFSLVQISDGELDVQ